jgi:Flp pilus assembly protein TadD
MTRSAVAVGLLGLGVAALLSGCAAIGATRAFQRGTAALERGEAERAVLELERAAALVPDSSAVHNHLGIAYEASDRPDDALRAYRRAVELSCENEAAQHNLRAVRAQSPASRP